MKSSGAVIEEASIAAGRQWLVLVVAIATWINTFFTKVDPKRGQSLWWFRGWFLLACSESFLLAVGVIVVCCDLSGFVMVPVFSCFLS